MTLTFLVSVDSGFQGIDEAGYHSCVRCCRYIRETQVNPQCRQAGMNIQCVPHRLTNTLLPEGVVFVGAEYSARFDHGLAEYLTVID
ncbi:hypothetical protein AWF49_26645 [Escherichia coli]|nr:hypothetical protein AWF49_26645 [Escherichia coli]